MDDDKYLLAAFVPCVRLVVKIGIFVAAINRPVICRVSSSSFRFLPIDRFFFVLVFLLNGGKAKEKKKAKGSQQNTGLFNLVWDNKYFQSG